MALIRLARFADIERLIVCGTECFEVNSWDRNAIEILLNRWPGLFFVAEIEGQVEAFIMGEIDDDNGYIAAVCVRERFRRRGIATALFDALIPELIIRGCNSVSLYVKTTNDSAQLLYEKLGFVRDKNRHLSYSLEYRLRRWNRWKSDEI